MMFDTCFILNDQLDKLFTLSYVCEMSFSSKYLYIFILLINCFIYIILEPKVICLLLTTDLTIKEKPGLYINYIAWKG